MQNCHIAKQQEWARARPMALLTRLIAVVVVLSGLTSSAALAEGFPEIGDRLLYADALPHYNLGNKYLAKQRYEKAIEKYWDAIGIYEHDADVYVNLSVAYRKVGNVQDAEIASRKAVKLKPEDWTTWSNLANLLMAQDKFAESYRTFNKALKCPGMPASEKAFIESNIDGMKKIMKARGLTIEGKEIAPPAVAAAGAGRKGGKSTGKNVVGKNGSGVSATASAGGNRAIAAKTKTAPRTNQLAGSKESELDTNAYDQWLGVK
ncbi:MAG: hypothetical protein SGJ27_01520 [Candidatus Melainabacteria bacterium]|nr:hypothetical protein [Candidatus Melainabacteria bacterium]